MADESVISTELQTARKQAGLSRERVASLLGVSAKTIERWELSGKVGPAQLRAIRAFYADVGQRSLDNDVTRGTSSSAETADTAGRMRRVESFQREMLRLGADDFEADNIDTMGVRFISAAEAWPIINPGHDVDVDAEIVLFLEFALRPWVLERIKQRAEANGRGIPDLPAGSLKPLPHSSTSTKKPGEAK